MFYRYAFAAVAATFLASCSSSTPCPSGYTSECERPDAGPEMPLICVDLDTDPLNCGACGTECPKNTHGMRAACIAGACDGCRPVTCNSVSPPYCGPAPDGCGAIIECPSVCPGSTCDMTAHICI